MKTKRYPESYLQEAYPGVCEIVNGLRDDERERRIFEALCSLLPAVSPDKRSYAISILSGNINIGS